MKIVIDKNINEIIDKIDDRMIIGIQDINEDTIHSFLECDKLAVVAIGKTYADKVNQLVNSRPNESKSITLIQEHRDVIVLLDLEGADKIYE